MDILFLSRSIPNDVDIDIRKSMKNTMDDAAIAWQSHIVDGLDFVNGEPITIFNYLPVKSWPFGCTKPWIKRFSYSHCGGANDINIPFCNIMLIKRILQKKSLIKEIKKWAVKGNQKKVIVAFSLYP